MQTKKDMHKEETYEHETNKQQTLIKEQEGDNQPHQTAQTLPHAQTKTATNNKQPNKDMHKQETSKQQQTIQTTGDLKEYFHMELRAAGQELDVSTIASDAEPRCSPDILTAS